MADQHREASFSRAFFKNLEKIEAEIGRRSRIRQMIERYDNNVVEAWKHLTTEITYGMYELSTHGLLHLSIEALMLEAEWRDVFTRENRKEALNALVTLDQRSDWQSRVNDDYVLG